MDYRETGQESSSLDLTQVFCLEKEIETLGQNIINDKVILENLKKEVAQTEQSLRETEARVKKEEAMLQELHHQKEILADQKTSLEKQREKLSEDIDEISKTLQEKDDRLNKTKDELAVAEREKRLVSKKRRLAWKAVLLSLIAIILCGWIYFNNEISLRESDYEDAMEEKRAAKSLYEDTKAEKEEALEKISQMESYAGPAIIKVNRVYNTDENMDRISDDLKESEIRFLTFDFDILFLEDDVKNATVYLDIYYPDGALDYSSNSPEGHTMSYEVYGIDSMLGSSKNVAKGWGNATESTYPAGTYRVDFIYKDVIIHSQKVIITE